MKMQRLLAWAALLTLVSGCEAIGTEGGLSYSGRVTQVVSPETIPISENGMATTDGRFFAVGSTRQTHYCAWNRTVSAVSASGGSTFLERATPSCSTA